VKGGGDVSHCCDGEACGGGALCSLLAVFDDVAGGKQGCVDYDDKAEEANDWVKRFI